MDRTLLLSPHLPSSAFRSPDEHLHSSSLPSPPTSPLMLSPVSPISSPRLFRTSLSSLSRTHPIPIPTHHPQQPAIYTKLAPHHIAGILATSPGSATSSDESRSPFENPLDVDFDSMADFDYSYPLSFGVAGSGYGGEVYDPSAHTSLNERKHHPIEINPTDREGISVASPYMFPSADLPFISGHLKQEYYAPNASDMGGSYAYMGVSSPEHPHGYAYTSSPESPFLDGATYYSSPASVPRSIPIGAGADSASAAYTQGQLVAAVGAHTASPAGSAAGSGQGGCDPRFVSGSPPQLAPVGSRISASSVNAGPATSSFPAPSQRYTSGAFGAANAEVDADAEGDVELPEHDDAELAYFRDHDQDEGDSGEEERSDDEDSDYLDAGHGGRHSRPFVVPSQAARVSALTTPVVGSSFGAHGHTHTHAQRSSPRQQPSRAQRPAAPAPVPVPNLTKKSRGRRVPTHPGVVLSSDGGARRTRGYMCRVPGCGKCFARGEHLKRHIRSIHTNEKPHKCPQSGCGKEFSRHDNLCQHMRVHRNFSAPHDGGVAAV
ncbi:hypothetical protein M0805_008196 [Coniferiporia weirii]|nr:hypothetical protein M0805_008196 [Coniferiporia weirii]